MIRIGGIGRDVSTVELMLHQMEPEAALQEVVAWLANAHGRIGQDFEATVELEGGKKLTVAVSETKKEEFER